MDECTAIGQDFVQKWLAQPGDGEIVRIILSASAAATAYYVCMKGLLGQEIDSNCLPDEVQFQATRRHESFVCHMYVIGMSFVKWNKNGMRIL